MRWKHRPPGSNWGEFGPDDQRGRMNLVTPEKVLQGVAQVQEGIAFSLSLPLDYPGGSVLNPRRNPPRLAATLRNGKQNFCFPLAEDNPDLTDVVSDDVALLTLQYSTQWDSFAHIGSRFDADGDGKPEIVFYNGFRAGEHVLPASSGSRDESWAKYEGTQAKALGIQNLAEHGAQGRGVLIDLHAHFGRAHRAVTYDELMQVMEKDRVQVDQGDMVCLYTGFADVLLEMRKQPDAKLLHQTCTGLEGRDERLLQWISDCGLAALIADNYAVEIIPVSLSKPKPHALMPLHEHCLFKNGIHLGEMWYLTELARWLREHKRSRFLLTAPPLRLPGAVGLARDPGGHGMKVVLVAGGSSGMGEASALELARRGWNVAVMSRTSPKNDLFWSKGDVANDADCRRAAQAVLDKWGRIDALVNSAGTTKFVAHADLEGLSGEDFLGILRVNLIGPFHMIRACAPALKAARGCVVNLSSVASILGTGSSIAYAASKAALDTMTFSLARALGPEIRLNIVAPGYVRTPWQIAAHGAEGAADLERRFAERAPLKAAAEPQDVADAVVWLIEGARRVTGEIIYVDGGMHIASPR